MYTYIGCQTFAGGFDVGTVQAGFKLIHRAEMKGGFGLANCLANRATLGYDWTYQASDPTEWHAPRVDVLIGNPPCSSWSVMANQGFRGANSPAMSCTWAFADYVVRVRPTIAVFESVQQAFTHKDGLSTMRALRAHVEEKTGQQWTLYHIRHNAYSVGGPAQRRRYFWLISRIPFGIEIPRVSYHPTLNDTIGDLVPLGATWGAQPYRAPAHPYAEKFLSSSGVVDGQVGKRESPMWRRMHDLIRGCGWHPGEAIAAVARRHYEQHGRLPESFAATEKKILDRDFNMGFTTPSRWNGERHAFVITGASLGIVIHPTEDRTITHREAARILGFPDDWKIAPLRGSSGLEQTWGKGITVDCGRWIGEWIKRALDGHPGTYTGTPLGEREFDIDVTHAWRHRHLSVPVATRRPVPTPDSHLCYSKTLSNDTTAQVSFVRTVPSGRSTMSDTATESKRGRPRPDSTIERDEKVYAQITGPMTKQNLVDATEFRPQDVYLSLYRLRAAGRVARVHENGKHVWKQATPVAAV